MKRALSLLVLILAMSACGSGTNDFTSDHNSQETIEAGVETTIELLSGALAHFPAAAFSEQAIVMFADVFASTDGTTSYFPTATQAATDLIAGAVLNTPADHQLGADVDVRYSLLNDGGVSAGQRYTVYRFDFDNLIWNRWGDTEAVIQNVDGVLRAVATLPTNGMRGFVGSTAIFAGHTVDALPPVEASVLRGTVYDSSGAPLATDVGMYFLVGAIKEPVALTNGRIPTGGSVANTVDSAADGTFVMQLPDNLVGQLVGLEFGREDEAYRAQELFDVLAPGNPLQTEVTSVVLRYGVNNIASRRVETGTDN